MRPLLRQLDTAPSYNSGYGYNPLPVIRIVNLLQPLGKDTALAVIGEYLRVASFFHSPGREGMFLVMRVLFDVPAVPGYMPHMYVGQPSPLSPDDPKRLPRYPILLQDDVPLLLAAGYSLAGVAEDPGRHVAYFRENGRMRDKPLFPSGAPLGLLNAWEKNAGWQYDKDTLLHGKLLIANQLLSMIDSVYRREKDAYGYRFWGAGDFEVQWRSIVTEVTRLDVHWNAEDNRYSFKDGSHLPELVRKFHRRHIWKVEGLNGEASLILERTHDKYVRVSLEWSGKTDQKMPAFELDVFPVRDEVTPLVGFRSMSISRSAGDEAFSTQTSQMELADGEEVRVRLRIGKGEQLSPVYRP